MLKKSIVYITLTLPLLFLGCASYNYAENEIVFTSSLEQPTPPLSSADIEDIHEKITYYKTLIAEFKNTTSPEIADNVADAYLNKGNLHKQLSEPQAAIRSYDDMIAIVNKASDSLIQYKLLEAYFNKAEILAMQLKKPRDAIDVYDILIAKLPSITGNGFEKSDSADAYLKKAQTQAVLLKEPQAAIDTYDAFITKYGAPEHGLSEEIMDAYLDKAAVLTTALKKHDDAIKIYDMLIAKYDATKVSRVRFRHMVSSYLNKAAVLAKSLKNETASLNTYDALITKLSTSEEALTETLANAYLKKADTLVRYFDKPQAAIDIYDFIVAKLDNSLSSEVKALIGKAYLNKALVQKQHLNDNQAEISTYQAMIEALSDDTDYYYIPALAQAYEALGVKQLILAKKSFSNKNKSLPHFLQALRYFKSASIQAAVTKQSSQGGFYIAYTNWLMGDYKYVENLLYQAFSSNNKQVMETTVAITKQHEVSADAAFNELTQQIWQSAVSSDQVIATLTSPHSPEKQLKLARAYLARAGKQRLQREYAIIATFETMITQLQDASNSKVQAAVASAYLQKAEAHSMFARLSEYVEYDPEKEPAAALASYDALITKFGNSTDPAIFTKVAEAYLLKAAHLIQNEQQLDENLLPAELCNTIIEKYGRSQTPQLQETVMMAYLYKAFLTKEPIEKIAIYEQTLTNFSSLDSFAFLSRVHDIHYEIAKTKLSLAKQHWKLIEKRNALLTEALQHLNTAENSPTYDESYTQHRIYSTIAYTHWLLGDQKAAAKHLKKALALGGERFFNALIEEQRNQKVTIRSDAEFITLIMNTWKNSHSASK